ncbi:MAG: hypothetical protein KDK89_18705 [Alphaproteobacteria bacterium]|nr:hypothetical protein [Alphaproteobacteria bacterium]
MTDIITSVTHSPSRTRLPMPKLPSLGIFGALARLAGGYGRAIQMAYVDPFHAGRKDSLYVPDVDTDGRDPNW